MENNIEKSHRSLGVQVQHNLQRRNPTRQSYMPFLTRNRQLTQKKINLSPGQYEIDNFMKKINSQHQMRTIDRAIHRRFQQPITIQSQIDTLKTHQKQTPGPTSYETCKDFLTKKPKKTHLSQNNKRKTQYSNISLRYPSIPTNHIKYGYKKKQNGFYEPIKKTSQQLQAEKEVNKKYLQTLINEKKYQQMAFEESERGNNIWQITKYINDYCGKALSLQDRERQKILHTPLKSNFFNEKKIQHVLHESKKYQNKRGPGSYKITSQLNSEEKKNKKIECFNSTEIRFKKIEKTGKQIKCFNVLSKTHTQNYIQQFRRSLKKANIKMRKSHRKLQELTKKIDLKENIYLINQNKEKRNLLHKEKKGKLKKPFFVEVNRKTKHSTKNDEFSLSEWENQENPISSTPFSKNKWQNM